MVKNHLGLTKAEIPIPFLGVTGNISLRFFYKHTKIPLIVKEREKKNMSLLASTFSLATHIYPSSEVVDDHADNLVLLVLFHRFHAHFSPGHANRAA